MIQATIHRPGTCYPLCAPCATRLTITRATFVPVWRRRQLADLAANGGRIVARSVTAGGRSVAL